MSKDIIYKVPHDVFQHMVRGAHSQYRDIPYWKSTIEPLSSNWNNLYLKSGFYYFNFDQINDIVKMITIPPLQQNNSDDFQRFNMFMSDLNNNWTITKDDNKIINSQPIFEIPTSTNFFNNNIMIDSSIHSNTVINIGENTENHDFNI